MDNQQPSNNIFYQKPKKGFGYIYKYTSPSNKSYVGQTINSLASRARNVVSGIGYKKCSLFWKAIQKYHFVNFKVEILAEVEVNELNKWEEYYIKKYNTVVPNGYNLTNGGEGGKTVSVFVYSAQNGKFIEHYNSLSEAALMTGVPIETISAILNDNNSRKIAHNLTFSKTYIPNFDIFKFGRNNYHEVYVYDQNGIYLNRYISIAEASKELKIAEVTISRHLQSKTLTCGYYFRDNKIDKIEEANKAPKKGKIVRQIDPATLLTVKVYPSLSLAAKEVGLSSSSSITRAIERKGKAKGYYWQVIEGSTTKNSENPAESVRDILRDEDIV